METQLFSYGRARPGDAQSVCYAPPETVDYEHLDTQDARALARGTFGAIYRINGSHRERSRLQLLLSVQVSRYRTQLNFGC